MTVGGQTSLAASGFTFGGLRARSNKITIDGLDNNDEYAGASRTELSPEIVHEFQVVNNGLSAEFGGASGGSINVVTKSGTNHIHGDAFIFGQNGALNARNPIENEASKPSLKGYRFGASNGGPVLKNRTFYYWALEQDYKRSQDDSDIDPTVASAINGFLASGAFPRLGAHRVIPGFFPIAGAETEASAKLDHEISDRNSLMLRYAFTNNREASDAFNTSGLTDPSARGSSFTEDQALVGSFVSLLWPRTVNDLRFQLAERNVTLRTNDQRGPEIDINGFINFGRPYAGKDHRREDHYEISDTFAVSKTRHLLKSGLVVNRVHLRAHTPDGFGAVYIFPGLADFLRGNADSFRQAFGDPSTGFAVTSYGFFAQDHWRVSRRLTTDLGVRYDFERLPSGFNQDTNNVSPRIGLAYSPSSRWVVRAGFGIFYDRYVLANLKRAVEKDGTHGFEQVVDGGAAATIFHQAQGGPLEAPMEGMQPSIFRPDPHLATSYSEQASFGVERQLSTNLTLNTNYLLVRGVKLSRTRNINLTPSIILTCENAAALGVANPSPQQLGCDFFGPGRLGPRFNDIELLEDSASSTYHGISFSLNRRLANEIEFSANYTISKTTDDASDFDEQPQNPYDLRADRGPSRNDQTQRFVLSGLFDLPFGEKERRAPRVQRLVSLPPSPRRRLSSGLLDKILGHVELAPIITVGSGRPVDPLIGLDSNRSHAFPLSARPLGFGRNTLKTPTLAAVDFRVLKYFPLGEHAHLDLAAEFFNLFNHTNISQINPFYGNSSSPIPGFTRPTEAFHARQVQFSIDFEY